MARFDESIWKLADDVKIFGRENAKRNIFQLVYDWLRDERKGKWVLVLDNADDARFLFEPVETDDARTVAGGRARMDYLPICAHGSIVITTRSRAVASELVDEQNTLVLQPMKQSEALALAERKMGQSSDATVLRKLVNALEYMPLAIAQAAAYIKKRAPRCTVEQYMDKLEKSDKSRSGLLNANMQELRRDREAKNSIFLTWQISFEHIHQVRRSAVDLLSLMSFFDHQGIPERVLRVQDVEKVEDDDEQDASSTTLNDEAFEEDIDTLRDYLFISVKPEGPSFEMHRLVQLAVRKWLESQGQHQRWAERSIRHLDEALPNGSYENWAICRTLYPHARLAVGLELGDKNARECLASVLHKATWFAWQQGFAAEAEMMATNSLKARKNLGIPNEDNLSSEHLLAIVLQYQGKYKEAEAMNRRALAGLEEKLGEDHPDTLTSVSNLASMLQYQGKYEEAEVMNQRALAGTEEKLGMDHPDTLTSVSNLASVLQAQGKYEEAEAMNRRALAGYKEKLGEGHPDTLTSVSNLALVLQYQGKYEESETMNWRALAGREEKLGEGHPSTQTSVSNLASVLQYQGKYEESEAMNRRALARKEEKLGEGHPDTLTSVSNLALVLQYQGKYEEAEVMNQRALAGTEEKLGMDHPDTLTSVSNLALVLQYQGKYEEAEAMNRRALAGYKEKLGEGHPDTLTSVSNLASVLQYQGKYVEAEAMNLRALAGSEEKLGENHPSTLASVNNLAHLLELLHRYDEATYLYERACAGYQRRLGDSHPTTVACLDDFRDMLSTIHGLEREEA